MDWLSSILGGGSAAQLGAPDLGAAPAGLTGPPPLGASLDPNTFVGPIQPPGAPAVAPGIAPGVPPGAPPAPPLSLAPPNPGPAGMPPTAPAAPPNPLLRMLQGLKAPEAPIPQKVGSPHFAPGRGAPTSPKLLEILGAMGLGKQVAQQPPNFSLGHALGR